MSHNLPRYITPALAHPWAITPEYQARIVDILARRIAGIATDPADIVAAKAAQRPTPQPQRGPVAIIPIHGPLAPRANLLNDVSGATSFDVIGAALTAMARRPDIKTILLDIDSPGGSVAGATELAATIRKVRAQKPVIAHGHFTIGSAAYWIGAQATKVYLSPSAQAGSLGCFTLHEDLSEALAKLGVKQEYISAGDGKVDGNPAAPLSADMKAHLQRMVDLADAQFMADIAHGRGVTAATVRGWPKRGYMYDAEEALARGLCDKVETFEDTLERLLPAGTSSATADDLAALSGAPDTPQDRASDTGQDRAPDAAWQARLERDLFAYSLQH